MSEILGFGYCEAILAWLALHPGGSSVQEIKTHTKSRVRSSKTFDPKFAKSLELILENTPFELDPANETKTIVPRSSPAAPESNVVLNLAHVAHVTINGARGTKASFDFARFEEIILENLHPAGTVKSAVDLKALVQAQAQREMAFKPGSFDRLFQSIINPMTMTKQVVVGHDAGGQPTYSIPVIAG